MVKATLSSPSNYDQEYVHSTYERESRHIKVAQAICGQILAYQMSDISVDKDSSPKYKFSTDHGPLSLQNYLYQNLIQA